MTYVMTTKTGDILIKTNQASNLEEAIEHFAKIKQLSRKEFLKLFLVTEIN